MKRLSVIRKIEDVNDFDEIMAIEVFAFHDPFSKELYLFDYLNHPYSEYFKLMLDGKIIGYIGLWVIYEDAQITTLAIDPNYQGFGYSNILMDFIITYLKERKCQNITLEVRVSNVKAIKLYEKYKFYKVTKRKSYYGNGEDAYLMKCDIS